MAILALVASLAACGVPTDGTTRSIAPTDVPYALAAPTSSTPAPTDSASEALDVDEPRVYFLDADLELGAVALHGGAEGGGPRVGAAQDVLDQLAAGPSPDERDDGLQTALGPDVELRLGSTEAGIASVEVVALSQDPSADRLPLAVGQIVLSVTSVPGVDGVRLQRNGIDREVPLPGGALTSRALTAQDYAVLVGAAG